MMSLKQLDALNVAQDCMKRMGPDEPLQVASQKYPDAYWKKNNDPRDWIVDQDKYLTDGNSHVKAQLFQDYIDNNSFEQWIADMQAEKHNGYCMMTIESENVEINYPSPDKEYNWDGLRDVFGTMHLWDELVSRIYGGAETMMTRLGYRWVSEEEEA
ncbi:recombination system host exonuclease inhibitor [Lactiplantibacillus plantarum]|uniref:recombination system host exonuclease inhibitor n=2 Tax=Lactiplantibacillus plantarum TaxID=1590 RepID=UPI0021C97E66|nr:hypothetical protein [Lactiplantibacillus plantarum]